MAYRASDYNSADGMMTATWGPILWTFLHLMSFNYPTHPTDAQRKDYCQFVLYVGKVLPCRHCRDNYERNLREAGFGTAVFRDRGSFSHFVYRLHAHVNKMLNKETPVSYAEVRNRMERCRARCTDARPDPNRELGCRDPLYATKLRSCLRFVPADSGEPTLSYDPACAAPLTAASDAGS